MRHHFLAHFYALSSGGVTCHVTLLASKTIEIEASKRFK